MKRNVQILLVLALTFGTPVFAQAEKALVAKSFDLRHKDPEKVASVIKPLMTENGSVSMQPGRKLLVVTDTEEALSQIAAVIGQYDMPPRIYSVDLKLVSAGREANPQPVPKGMEDLAEKLSGVLRFNSFRRIGEISASGEEGDSSVVSFDGYRASFDFGEYDPVSRTLRISEFRLDRTSGENADSTPLLKTSLNVGIGQTVILGAARQPNAGRALMIVVRARDQ